MKTAKINQLIKDNFKLKVYLSSDKNYNKMILKTLFYNKNTDIVYPVYYNHVKKHLTKDQLYFIEIYNTVKNFTFSDKVDVNMKYNNNKETEKDIAIRVMLKSITKKEYLEQL